LSRQAGPYPLEGLVRDDLRHAKSAKVHFQGIGLQQGGGYVSLAKLNGVSLGQVPACGGNEAQGTWGDATMPLPAQAITTLEEWNTLVIENPNHDYFKVRRFWVELELADGRRCSSHITLPTCTQPPDWKYSEGSGIPFDEDIRYTIRFPLR